MSSNGLAQAIGRLDARRGVLSFVFPVRCVVCSRPTESGAALCAVCACRLDRPLEEEVQHSIEATCPSTLVDAVHALWVFEKAGPIQQIHRAIKYGNQPFLGAALGQMMAEEVVSIGWRVDIVVPVPIHKSRRLARGYNQVSEIASSVAQRLGARYEPAALRRVRATRTQTSLSAEERSRNVASVLEADPDILAGARVLVVDDVITSGATIAAAASAARSAGATGVSAFAMGFARR